MNLEAAPDTGPGLERRKALARRVKVGAYYTDGRRLAEVYKVYELGHFILRVVGAWEEFEGYGIEAFRGEWWLVREPERQAA